MSPIQKSSHESFVRISLLVGIGLMEGLGCTPQDVHGTAIETWGSPADTGSQSQQPWRGGIIQALPPDGMAERARSASVDETGNFLIPAVPAGFYWLAYPDDLTDRFREANTYVWTDAREFDLGLQGLTMLVPGTARMPMPTPITGLQSVEPGDFMEAYGTSYGWSMSWNLPTPGAITTTWPTDKAIPFRVSPSEQIIVKQWQRSLLDNRLLVESTVRAGRSAAPADKDTEVPVTLTDAAPASVDVKIDHSAIMGQLSGLSGSFDIQFKLMADGDPSDALPGDRNLLLKISNVTAPAGDPSANRLRYMDPYPASWSRRYELQYLSITEYRVDGTHSIASCRAGLDLFGAASELSQGPLRPNLSLPQMLAIDGSTAMVGRDDVELAPTITWKPPAIGEASVYLLRIVQLVKEPEREYHDILAGSFLTSQTEARIPAGVLQPGGQYYLELIAVAGLGSDALTTPRAAVARRWSQSSAHVCSAAFHTR